MNWSYIAGFFDGEGSVEYEVRQRTLAIFLTISQSDQGLLQLIKKFMDEEGIGCKVVPGKRAWRLRWRRIDDVKKVAEKLLPIVVLKQKQLKTVLDYLSNRINVDKFVEVMNEEIRVGRRKGEIRPLPKLPYTRKEAKEIQMKNAGDRGGRRNARRDLFGRFT